MTATIRLHPDDNVVVAINDLAKGDSIPSEAAVLTCEPIAAGHKLATRRTEVGQPVIKYGQPIGQASETIEAGRWVHVHNVEWRSEKETYCFSTDIPQIAQPDRPRSFQGYRRASGKAGTRNYLAILSSVNCSASVSKAIARHFTYERLQDYPNVDGVVAFTHGSGCAMQFAGQQHQILNRVMGGIARHPNVGGYLLIGLGCEKATLDYLVADQRLVQIDGHGDTKSPPTLTMQNLGGTQKTIAEGIRLVEELLPRVNDVQRETHFGRRADRGHRMRRFRWQLWHHGQSGRRIRQ